MNGVGYITPAGEVTPWGHKIDTSVEIPDAPDAQQDALDRRYGEQWRKGVPGPHSTDHRSALLRLWVRGQAGVGTGGLLKDDGRGFSGVPTLSEVYDSYYGTKSRVLEVANVVLEGEYGYGATPLSPAPRQRGWLTSMWRLMIGPFGSGKYWPASLKAEVVRQCDLIESGAIPGWEPSSRGGWRRV